MILIILLFVLIFVLVAIPIRHKRFVNILSQKLKDVPGPTPNPYFGNLLLFGGASTEKFLRVLSDLQKQYGSIFNLYTGPCKSSLVIADEKLLQAVLSSTKLIDKTFDYTFLEGWLGKGLLTSTGRKWKQRRRMITPAFHFSILENFVTVFEKVGDVFIKKLEEHSGKESFNIYPLISLLTLDIICETAMGITINAQANHQSEYIINVKKVCEILIEKSMSPLVGIDHRLYFLTPGYYKEKYSLKIVHSHTREVIDRKIKELERAQRGEKEKVDDIGTKKKVAFLDLLLKSTIDGQYLTRGEIQEEVDTFMFEGHDTTSSAIAFALYALANHPTIQEKVLEEQKSLFEDLQTAKPTMTQLNEMKYLDLVIKETLRLYPPVPMYARSVQEEFKWENITIPKGHNLTIFAFEAHRNPDYYPEPLKFIPERFENIDGTNPYMYIPFSAGPRNCIGQKFAMLEMKSTISKVIRHYELIAAKNHKLILASELILISKTGLHMSLRKRK